MAKKYKNIITICLIFLIIFTIYIIFKDAYKIYKYNNNDYYKYFTETNNKSLVSDIINENEESTNNYTTIIDHTIKFENQNIKSKEDAIDLIEDNALQQENKCNNKLNEIELDLKNKTNIHGINFCELSEDNARNISNTIKDVYDLYPIIKDYVTNVTIVNDGGIDSYIAAFKPAFTFATSNSSNKFPFVIKIQVFLNASYYLNNEYLNNVIENAVSTNYFPDDTTKESLIAHEFGHVITYVLDIKYNNSINTLLVSKDDFKKYADTLNNYSSSTFSKMIVTEAYNNYIKENEKIDEETYRENISLYANTKDGSGNVLYNETIAEAFHDYYLHKDSCKKESMEIIKVLNKYIKEL